MIGKCNDVDCKARGGNCYAKKQPNMNCVENSGFCKPVPAPFAGKDLTGQEYSKGGNIFKTFKMYLQKNHQLQLHIQSPDSILFKLYVF